MRTRWISALCLGCLLPLCLGQSLVADDPTESDILAIEFLGAADSAWYPETQEVLINHLLKDPREEVRLAAVKAITRQIQRGKPPLGFTALYGWRDLPDPLIWDQLGFLLSFSPPMPLDDLLPSYQDRRFQQNQHRFQHRRDVHRDTATPEIKKALIKVNSFQLKNGLYFEPSVRIRYAAGEALLLCQDVEIKDGSYDPDPPSPDEQQAAAARVTQKRRRIRRRIGGRADTANRLNLFDNMSLEPETRAWVGFQHAVSQNNAIRLSDSSLELLSILTTNTGRRLFIEATGLGSGIGTYDGLGAPPSSPNTAVNPDSPLAAAELEGRYATHNSGRSTSFLRNPNTNLYRAGFEYAVTSDFGIAVQAQYVSPLDDVEQPSMFSNPIIQMKHVLYRDDETILASMFAIAPQIPTPDFAIVEDTSRLSPGLGVSHTPKEDWFVWGVTGFSFPTDSDQIKTWDYSLGLGHFLYKHESLEVWSETDRSNAFLLGIVPQFEVLGKHIMGNNSVTGLFDLSTATPRRADGTLNEDGTTTVYLPQYLPQLVPVTDAAFFFEEPRHVVDLTMSLTLLFTQQIDFTLGISVPVTGGTARQLEFLTYINKSF